MSKSVPFKLPSDWAASVPETLLRQLRCNLSRCLVEDSTGTKLTNAQLLIRSYLLAEKLRDQSDDQYIGVLLPSTAMSVVTAIGVMLADRIPVFLNFTASDEAIDYAKAKCNLQRIISSRKFLDKIDFQNRDKILYLEELFGHLTGLDKAKAVIRTYFVSPSTARKRYFPTISESADSTATVLFSSGSTGQPKGVVLSHRNLQSNIAGVVQMLDLSNKDVMLGSLPFFHSFGYIGNFLLPLYHGIHVVLHPNPTDSAKIGEMIAEHRCTLLFATPTFLQGYTRKCDGDQFASIQLVIVGAEKLQESIATKFQEKFGIAPIEGFGCTELSPVVSINVPSDLADKRTRCGKLNSVGTVIPGVAVKIVDPESGECLPANEDGLLLVKGPNVMQGYLGEPEKTAAVISDGWYNTGDMAHVDEDGYIFITGRYSRFSKIGGEMIPHGGIEEAIHRFTGSAETQAVVTSIADPVRGERLIILHLALEISPEDVINGLREAGLPNLWIPKSKDFFEIESIPVLGSGKLNLKEMQSLAESFTKIGNLNCRE